MPFVHLIILDFDGVLTDNRVYILEDGREAVACHRGDGWGIQILQSKGIEVIILSTEANPVVSARADKLNLECIQGCEDKAEATKSMIQARSLNPEQVMYVGNDSNDLEAMKLVGHRVAPADAHSDILAIASLVTKTRGGNGVIRELADLLDSDQVI
jgi:3-deoxy-D-manno-octulosonate 8-phosphate phosphatase (KDO 8-P phosphatase)